MRITIILLINILITESMKAMIIPPIITVKRMEATTMIKEIVKITTTTILMMPKPEIPKTATEHRPSTATTAINTTHIANTKGINITIMENLITGMKVISTRDTTMERSTRRMIILLTTTLATEGMGMTTEVTSMAITDMAGTITARALCR
jgi:hypothetical protein